MRTGVAANHVTAPVQFPKLFIGQESRLPDPVSSDKKVSAPTMAFQHGRHWPVGAHTAIVKGQADPVIFARYSRPDGFVADGAPDGFQVSGKFIGFELIDLSPRAGESAAVMVLMFHHVVIVDGETPVRR
jgi:hypothetical protein